MFAGVGIGAFMLAVEYPAGTPARMGPGMLPMILGALLGIVGIALSAQSFVVGDDDAEDGRLSPPGLGIYRAAFFVLLSLLLFGLLVRPLGLIPATIALVLVASRAEPGHSLLGAAVLSVILAGMAAGIFVYGLGLPFRVWP